MKTRIKKNGDTLIISMGGKISVESQEKFKENISTLITGNKTDSVPQNLIFDFSDLEFVGSSGISSFIQTLKEVNGRIPNRLRFANVKSEFQRVMKAFDEDRVFDFFDDESIAPSKMDH